MFFSMAKKSENSSIYHHNHTRAIAIFILPPQRMKAYYITMFEGGRCGERSGTHLHYIMLLARLRPLHGAHHAQLARPWLCHRRHGGIRTDSHTATLSAPGRVVVGPAEGGRYSAGRQRHCVDRTDDGGEYSVFFIRFIGYLLCVLEVFM